MDILVEPKFGYFAGEIYWMLQSTADETVKLIHIDDVCSGKYLEPDCKVVETMADSFLPLRSSHPNAETLRSLWRLDKTPCELMKEGLFPFDGLIKAYVPCEEDLLHFIDQALLLKCVDQLGLWYETFDAFWTSSEDYVFLMSNGYPCILLFYSIMEILTYSDEEEELKDCLRSLKERYLVYRSDPVQLMSSDDPNVFSMIYLFEAYSQKNEITEAEREKFIKRVDEMQCSTDPVQLDLYVSCYYDGNAIISPDYKKAKVALNRLYKLRYNRIYSEFYSIRAANHLGHIYYDCEGTEHNYGKALKYFSYATEYNDHDSAVCLSDMFAKGHAVPKSPETSLMLLNKVFSLITEDDPIFPDVAMRLGIIYRDGILVPKNEEKAYDFFMRAKNNMENFLEDEGELSCSTTMEDINREIASLGRCSFADEEEEKYP